MGDAVIITIGVFTELGWVSWLLRAAAVYALSSSAAKLFAPKAAAPRLQDRTVTVRDPLAARRLIYGQARVGGIIVYIDTTNNNRYLHLVVAYASHEIESFDSHYFDEHELTLSGNDVTAPDHLAGKVKVYEHLGLDSQTADMELVNASTQWTTAHRLRGIAYTYYRLEYDAKAFAAGIPNITSLLSGKKVYDPRTGTTAYSNNAALCSTDYLLDTRYGLGVPQSDINMTVLTTSAGTCDEDVTLKAGGTEDRYTCNGIVDLSEAPSKIIQDLATAKAAPTVYSMGEWHVLAGSYRTPALTFDESDLAGPIRVQTRHARSDLYNHVKGTYISPDNQWQPTDFPVVQSSTYLAEDNGEVIYRDVELPYTTSPSTAQRIGLLQLNADRRQITANAPFKLSALDVIPGDTIKFTNSRMGWTEKVFEVTDWRFVLDNDSRLVIDQVLRETDSAVYTWSTADESAGNAAPTTNLPDFRTIGAPTGLSVSSKQVPTGTGTDETYQALLEWTSPSDYFVLNGGLIEVQYKVSADSEWFPSWYVSGNQDQYLVTMLEADESYDFRIRSFNYIASSSWVTVTGITILRSGGVATSEDWGEWTSSPTARTSGCGADFGEWVSAASCSEDWGSWT